MSILPERPAERPARPAERPALSLRHQIALTPGATATELAAAFASLGAARLADITLVDEHGAPVTRRRITTALLNMAAPVMPTPQPAEPEAEPEPEPEPPAAVPVQIAPVPVQQEREPVRTDAELVVQLRRLPRRPDGTVPIQRAVKALGVGSGRAKRLLTEAGLLRETKPRTASRNTSRATSVRRALATA